MLAPPADLPAALRGRYERVAVRLQDLEVALPPELAESALRVSIVSDFVLAVLLRHPQTLLERMRDTEPLEREGVVTRLALGSVPETEAMAKLRRSAMESSA